MFSALIISLKLSASLGVLHFRLVSFVLAPAPIDVNTITVDAETRQVQYYIFWGSYETGTSPLGTDGFDGFGMSLTSDPPGATLRDSYTGGKADYYVYVNCKPGMTISLTVWSTAFGVQSEHVVKEFNIRKYIFTLIYMFSFISITFISILRLRFPKN